MNVSEPEADTEYSRAPAGSKARERRSAEGSSAIRTAVLVGASAAAAMLLVAEFLPLFEVRTSARHSVVTTVQSGSHHSYALIPIALLVALLAAAWRRTPARLTALAMALLGVVALVIALARDLPDAQSSGLERSAGTYVTAAASPQAGLYLETAGAIVLLITGAGGLILSPSAAWTDGRVQTKSSRRRSAS
jgi:hypothetical protein